MNLQEKHLEAIEEIENDTEYDELTHSENIAKASTEITKDYMKRFAEWLDEKEALQSNNKWVLNDNQIIGTTEELIEIFLNNENQSA